MSARQGALSTVEPAGGDRGSRAAAPPGPAEPDELHALVEEARQRTRWRLRRNGTLAAGLALLAAGSYEIAAEIVQSSPTDQRAGKAAQAAGFRCAASEFRTKTLPRVGGVYILAVTNLGPTTCRIDGAPRITFITRDGKVAFRPPEAIANHSTPIQLGPGASASVWVNFLGLGGNRIINAKKLALRVSGIAGAVSFTARAHSGELDSQQLVVSGFAPGLIEHLPASTSYPPRCRRLQLSSRMIGAWAGASATALVLTNSGKAPCSVGGFPRLGVASPAGRRIYNIPEQRTGAAHAIVQLNPGHHASAWEILPDCGALYKRLPPLLNARQTVQLAGIRPITGPIGAYYSPWPRRCLVTVSAIAGGIFQGFQGASNVRPAQ